MTIKDETEEVVSLNQKMINVFTKKKSLLLQLLAVLVTTTDALRP